MRDPKKLDRLLRVRTLQLDLKRADEMRAAERVASETALAGRIAALADEVEPSHGGTGGFALAAASHLRQRLQASHQVARFRVEQANTGLERARETTREAKRDHGAIEKLIERNDILIGHKERRALEDMPATRRPRR